MIVLTCSCSLSSSSHPVTAVFSPNPREIATMHLASLAPLLAFAGLVAAQSGVYDHGTIEVRHPQAFSVVNAWWWR